MSKCECEKCLHYDACKKISDVHGLAFGSSPFCDHYKSKSLFVELPCAVSDIVYVTDNKPNEVTECKITSFTIDCDGVSHFSYEPLNKREAGFASCSSLIAEWGDTVFLDRAEAENKLKEMENLK